MSFIYHLDTGDSHPFPFQGKSPSVSKNIPLSYDKHSTSRRLSTLYAGQKVMVRFEVPLQKFLTGSRYVGECNDLGFSGKGIYRFPHGVYYQGTFNDRSEFHGIGTLIYPNGQKLQGLWLNGVLQTQSQPIFTYPSGEVVDDNMKYCQYPDRRFHTEIQKDLYPPGQEKISTEGKKLPAGCYRVADGVFNPIQNIILRSMDKEEEKSPVIKEKEIFKSVEDNAEKEFREAISYQPPTKFKMEDHTFISEIPSKHQKNMIEEYFERAEDKPVGYDKKLFPVWTAGRKYELYRDLTRDWDPDEIDETIRTPSFHTSSKKIFSFINRPHRQQEILKKAKKAATIPSRQVNRK